MSVASRFVDASPRAASTTASTHSRTTPGSLPGIRFPGSRPTTPAGERPSRQIGAPELKAPTGREGPEGPYSRVGEAPNVEPWHELR